MQQHIVIIGNGITGTTVARELRKRSDDKITLLSSETRHFFSRPALMYLYMGQMQFDHVKPYEDWFWEKNRIHLILEYVEFIDFNHKHLKLRNGTTLSYDKLVLATGSKSNLLKVPGDDLNGVQGFYSYPDLLAIEEKTRGIKSSVVVGGGLIGVELAEMFRSRGMQVTFFVRENSYWNAVLPLAESQLIARQIRAHGVDLRLGSSLREIRGDGNANVQSVITQTGDEIACSFVGAAVGVSPNIQFLKNTELETDRGILVNHFFQTNIPEVYAAGDCAQLKSPSPGRRAVEQVWYTGKMQGEFLARNICGECLPYSPGIWFNSAKFFDIEYQTYGEIPTIESAEFTHFYWEHPQGKKSVRIVSRKNDGTVTGFNFFGIRARHQVCERWIAEKRPLTYVIDHFKELNFDPEFFQRFHKAVREQFLLLNHV